MREQDYIQKLKDYDDVPKIVRSKAEEALAQIAAKSDRPQVITLEHAARSRKAGRRNPKRLATILIAAALSVGTVAAAGVTALNWSEATKKTLSLTESQMSYAEGTGLAAVPEDADGITSVTADGITVSAVQTIADSRYAYIELKIEGLKLDEGDTPSLEEINVRVDGTDVNSYGSFYNGWVVGEDGRRAVFADGSPVNEDSKEVYLQEDGSFCYQIYLYNAYGRDGEMIGRDVHVSLKELGRETGKLEMETLAEGPWELRWKLEGNAAQLSAQPDFALDDTGAVVKELTISPLSLKAELVWPPVKVPITYVDENGEEHEGEEYTEPPMLSGVRLKDGTILAYICGGGSMGWRGDVTEEGELSEPTEETPYVMEFGTERLLTPEDIDAVLFQKRALEIDEPVTEDAFYAVPFEPEESGE